MDTNVNTHHPHQRVGRLPAIEDHSQRNKIMDTRPIEDLTAAIKALENVIRSMNFAKVEETHKSRKKLSNTERPKLPTCKVPIHIRLVFLKIGEIDTLKEQFSASIFLCARWREPSLDNLMEEPDNFCYKNYWSPKIHIDNALGDPKELCWHTVTWDKNGTAYMSEKRRVNGNFQEKLELTDFPFDTQELTISLISERSEAQVEFVEEQNSISQIHKQSFIDEQEWYLHDHVEFESLSTSDEYNNIKYKRPGLKIMCRAARKPGYFIWNFVLIMFFIVSLSLLTFTISPDKPQNRIQVTFILVLSMVAFKFTVSNSLPKISYLTYLDIYVLISFCFLCSVCIWHGIVQALHGSVQVTTDKYVLCGFGTCFFLYHVIFGIMILAATHSERYLNISRDKEYVKKILAIRDKSPGVRDYNTLRKSVRRGVSPESA